MSVFIVTLVLVLVFLLSVLLVGANFLPNNTEFFGGGENGIIIVDTLNLLYWMKKKGDHTSAVFDLLRETTPKLKSVYYEKIFFVVKNVNFDTNQIQELCNELKICVALTYDYVDPPKGVEKNDTHSAVGKDDLYMILLAQKYKCAILSNDKFRDIELLKTKIQPYRVVIYNYWAPPIEDWVRPEIKEYKKIRKSKIRTIKLDDFF